jgi:ribonuclease HI
VIRIDPARVKWYNPTFLVPKGKTGKYRKILDCRQLNGELRDTCFKMEGAETVTALMEQGDWGTSIDIHSAFNHVPVHEALQPYLAFEFQGNTYTYRGMPFGIKHAPRVFTYLMRRVAMAIRERWQTRLVIYMDDLLLLFHDQDTAAAQTREIAQFLERLGWTLAKGKCEMTPSQKLDFLGWEWNLSAAAVKMTQTRRADMKAQLSTWKERATHRTRTPTREIARLIGNINFLRLQVPEASLYMKEMDKIKIQAVSRSGWAGFCTPNPAMLGEILWWSKRVTENYPRDLTDWPTASTLTTDASPHGWGAILQTRQEPESKLAFGAWNANQQKWTSNRKELWAVWKGIQAFRRVLKSHWRTTLLVRSDNSTVVEDLNRQSAARTLAHELRRLLNLAAQLRIRLRAAHVPGVENTTADRLSRMGALREYYMKEEYLERAKQQLTLEPDTDPFAASPYLPSETATGYPREALAQDWTGQRVFLHPPPHLMTRTLRKAVRDKVQAMLIAPAWTSQPWSPLLSRLSRQTIILGRFEEVMQPTERFKREGWAFPPGNVMAVSLDTRMTEESNSSYAC